MKKLMSILLGGLLFVNSGCVCRTDKEQTEPEPVMYVVCGKTTFKIAATYCRTNEGVFRQATSYLCWDEYNRNGKNEQFGPFPISCVASSNPPVKQP